MNILNVITKVRVGLILLVMFLISSTAWAVATPVRYIDENGDVQEISKYTKVSVNKDGALNIEGSGWYVVKGSIYATKAVDIDTDTDVNLVLTDSSELTIDLSADTTGAKRQHVFKVGQLTIYSQEDQSGKLTLKSSAKVESSYGISASGDVIIAGGYVESTAKYAIYTAGKTIRIIRGTVSVDAPAKIIDSNGLNSKNIIIDGGRIFANSSAGFFAENNLSINGGYIDITGKDNGCFVRNDFFMTDGSIKIQEAINGIKSLNGNIYISGGSIDATASDYRGTGLFADKGKIVVSGGSIDLSEQYIKGISAVNDSLVLGWTNTYDYIKSPRFSSGKAVVVGAYDKDGTLVLNSISFKDEEGNGYTGDITGNLKEIQNKKLTPAFKIALETGDENVVVDPLFVGVYGTSTKPADPKRNGYKFVGWYTDKDLKTEFDWNEKITQDITLYAKWSELPFVKYIDEYGKEQQTNFCEELTSDTDVNNLASGWYVVKSGEKVVLGDIVNLKADYKIILEDGSHLTVDSIAATNVAIYGQKEQTGTLSVSQDQNTIANAVLAFHTLAIYGGDITVGTSENQPEAGLVAGNTAIIAGGSVSVFAKYAGLEAANVNVEDSKIDPGVHITGGEVSITVLPGDKDKANAGLGFGIVTNNKAYLTGGKLSVTAPMGVLALDGVVLDWTNESDFYTVGDYNIQNGVLSIADGKALKDENGDLYYGQYDVKNISNVKKISIFNGKTLSACDAYGIEFVYDDKSETKMFVSGSKPEAFSPVLPGFKFLGWFTSKEQNAEKFDFDVARTESAVVYAKWEALAPVDYIDENGETKTVTDYIELVGGEDPDNDVFKKGGWFVVKENVTYRNDFVLGNFDAHLILADGVKLTVDVCAGLTDKECDQKNSESDESKIYINNLFIYAQSLGENMGQFIVRKYKEERAFVVKDSLVVNGGVVDLAKGERGVIVKELVLNNGKIQISDVKTGIYASDVVAVRNGSINISNCEKGFDIENFKMTDGNVTVSCKEYGFDSFQFMIDGGTVDAIASVAVKAYDSLVVNGGSIKAYAIAREVYDPYKTGPYAIYSQNRNIYLNGGYVSADGDVTPDDPQGLGIVFGCSIYLNGGTIKGQRYFMSPDVEKGLQYSDEDGHSYTGTVDSREIAGKTLFPVKPNIDISYDQSGAHATINANYIGEDPFVVKYEIEVADVKFERDFTTEGYSTVVLPFNVKTSNLVGIDSVLSFAGVVLDDNKKKAVAMQLVWEKSMEEVELQAYTPYMIKMNKKALEVLGSVMLEPNRDAFTEKDGWEFRGTYSFMKWTEDSPDLGRVYGFAASAEGNVSAGQFVKLAAGASIRPLRAYLIHKDSPSLARANGSYANRSVASITDELPEQMNVVIVGKDKNGEEHTTVIGQFNTRSGEFRANNVKRLFDLKGRPVNKDARKVRGAYYRKNLLH